MLLMFFDVSLLFYDDDCVNVYVQNELMNLSEDLMKENGDLRKAKEKLEQSLISW